MPIYEDAVRPFQLPQNAPATVELNLFNAVSQAPITVVAGQNGSIGALPPIQTSQRTYSLTITSYMDQTATERRT